MFEGIKGKCLNISKDDYQELKKWEEDENSYTIVKYIFQTSAYKNLSLEYKNRVYQALSQLQDMELDFLDLNEALKTFWEFFRNWEMTFSENYYYYLEVLLDYPTFPIMDAYLFAEYPDKIDRLLLYTRIEAKLCSSEEDFRYYTKEFEEIVKNEKLRELGLTDVVVNGIINTQLPKDDLVSFIYSFLAESEDYSLIFKLFEAPTMDYIYLVDQLLRGKENIEEGHILEMIDMIYNTPYEELEELQFNITHQLIYEEMSFEEASKYYHNEAMKILDEANKPIKSYTRVRVPMYEQRF